MTVKEGTSHCPFGQKFKDLPEASGTSSVSRHIQPRHYTKPRRRRRHYPWPVMSIEAPNKPPQAKQVPAERTYHGDMVTDEYAWLADRADPDTIAYLEAENAYTEAATAALAPLADQIFAEIKARTQESDLSVPVRKGGWWHYARKVEGETYGR